MVTMSSVPSAGLIPTPDRRLRVFVSSTLTELAEERRAVRRAIEALRLIPVMFDLGARAHPPRDLYRAYLAQSEIFLGVYGESYGWIAPGADVSGVEDEYNSAGERPRLLYVKEPVLRRDARLADLILRFESDDRASYTGFRDSSELQQLVENDLAVLLTERFSLSSRADRAHDSGGFEDHPVPLPFPATSTIGRDADIEAVSALLRGGARLVTLTGPGGIGKSRLALEVALLLSEEVPDVRIVSLSNLTEPDDVLREIGLRFGVRTLGATTDAVSEVARHLVGRRRIVVLDNFEQVIDAAVDIAAILDRCPQLQVLVTSRQVLRVRSEREYPVAPLDVPSPMMPVAAIEGSPAVRLFIDRAQFVRPDFRLTLQNAEVIADICRMLDGLPLAIELAASRTRLLRPPSILRRLTSRLDLLTSGAVDLPERQRTLRATIDWSHDLLDDDERALFAELGVFVGGGTLEAVDAICSAPVGDDALEIVFSLLEKSLLLVADGADEPRIRMLEVVREYALERLRAGRGEAECRRRHVEWYLGFAEAVEEGLRDSDQAVWIERAKADTPNLRAAVIHALASGDLETVARFCWALTFPAFFGGYLPDVRDWCDRVIEADVELPPSVEARLFAARGFAAVEGDAFALLGRILDPALDKAHSIGDRVAEGALILLRSMYWTHEQDYDRASADIEQALSLATETRDGRTRLYALSVRGGIELAEGRLDASAATNLLCLDEARRMQCLPVEAQSLEGLGYGALVAGDTVGALERFRETAMLHGSLHPDGLALCLEGLAGVALARDNPAGAAAAIGAADAVRESAGVCIWPLYRPLLDSIVDGTRQRLDPESFTIAWNSLRTLPAEAALKRVLALAQSD